MIGLKGFKLSGFDGGHPGVVISKFSEEQVKPCFCGYLFSKISWLGSHSMPE